MNLDSRKPAIDRCIEILQHTNDGNHLAPEHLYLVQAMTDTNAYGVSASAEVFFDELHRRVMNGSYDHTKVWFRGIENLTRDHEGYVYWRGISVEHYSFSADDKDSEYAAAKQLVQRCLDLEAKNIPVNGSTVLSPLFAQMPAESAFLSLLMCLYTVFTDDTGRPVCLIVHQTDCTARALSFRDGQIVAENFADAYDAYHGCGFSRHPGETTNLMNDYAHLVAALELGGFTPAVVAPLLY